MSKMFSKIFIIISAGMIASCSQVLQTVNLELNTEDASVQEKFKVIEKTLTIKEARKQNKSPYVRIVTQNKRGDEARPIPENLALVSNFPKYNEPLVYKIGIGDTLNFSRLIENNPSPSSIEDSWPKQNVLPEYILGIGDTLALTLINNNPSANQTVPLNNTTSDASNENQNFIINSQPNETTINSRGRIGSDGSVLLLEIGRLEADGKSLNQLRSEVRNILIRNGVSPRFQLEIVEFRSKKSYLTINNTSKVIVLNDQRTTLRDILTSAGVGFQPGVITRIRLQRDGKEYIVSLRGVYSDNSPYIEVKSGDHIFVEDTSAKVMSESSIVDHEGNVVFEGVGKVRAAGHSLDEVRKEIEDLIQQVPGSKNAFQIQITNFASQTAVLNILGKPGGVITIRDVPISLEEVLTQSQLGIESENITRINLYRQNESYSFTLDDVFNSAAKKIYLQPNDRITAEFLKYKDNKIFILGGVTPRIFKIDPANRESLADVLFTPGGALSSSSAKRSEIYLLRGKNPTIAYHLDARSPTRLIVADAMELRPNDILYVAEQPIISFNRTLATIVPLRILLRDIQDENIP